MPVAMRSRISFYNVGVELPHAPSNSSGNVLAKLRKEARPSDFVVMKIDFDSVEVEWALVNEIATDPSLGRLVDEIFFEHVYYFDGFDFGWGANKDNQTTTVDEMLALMRRLREQGIRAHFWV